MKRRFDLKGRAIRHSQNLYSPEVPSQDLSTKGQLGGLCNRSACLAPNATWYNWGSLAHYCFDCACLLNWDSFNARDAFKQKGMALCQPTELTSEYEKKYHERKSTRYANDLRLHEESRQRLGLSVSGA